MRISSPGPETPGTTPQAAPAPRNAAEFGEAMTIAQRTARDTCKELLKDFERLVNALQSLIRPLQDAESRRDAPEAQRLSNRAARLLQDLSRTVQSLKDCAVGVGRDGQPLLNDAERALLGRLMDRARKAAEAGDLPIPDELYFKARGGDPDAIRRLGEFLKSVGEGAGKGAEVAAQIIFGILGILGSLGRRPAF